MNCYKVSSDSVEAAVLAFAESAGRAKVFALSRSSWFAHSDFVDLKANRVKKLDGRFPAGYVTPDAPGPEDWRALRDAGFYELDREGPACRTCGLNEFQELPESILDDSDQCAGCKGKEKSC